MTSLILQLDGHDITLVPISSVQERSEDSSNSQTALLGLSFLSIFIAGILLFIANSRKIISIIWMRKNDV